jgi:hypothetical protein
MRQNSGLLFLVACALSGAVSAQSIRVGADGSVDINAGPGGYEQQPAPAPRPRPRPVEAAPDRSHAPEPASRWATPAPGTPARGQDVQLSGMNKSTALACANGKATVTGSNHVVRLSGNCTSILVNGMNNDVIATSPVCHGPATVVGSNNKVKLAGSCSTLVVDGMNNDVTGMQVEAINVSGSNNRVGWRDHDHAGRAPAVTENGMNNEVFQVDRR